MLPLLPQHLLPEIAAPGDDHNYGSSAMNDVTALQVRLPEGRAQAGVGGLLGLTRRKEGASSMAQIIVQKTWSCHAAKLGGNPPRPLLLTPNRPEARARSLRHAGGRGQPLPRHALPCLGPPAPARLPQALSKRIHYGMFVAEAKFRKQTAEYTELIRRQDADAILQLLTDRAVELKVRSVPGQGWATA